MHPQPTERAKSIFQGVCVDAKFGRTLSNEENNVRKFILTQSPALGRIPSIDEIRKAFTQFPNEKINTLLNNLDQLDVIHLDDDKTAIAAAYPFSGSETPHIVTLKGERSKKIYAMCAIDALGICFMLNCDLSIESACYHCGESIEIEIKNNEIISMMPENIAVWCDAEYSCCAATSVCRNWNFFSSEQHFIEWKKEKNGRKGKLLQIGEAFYLGKLFFSNRI